MPQVAELQPLAILADYPGRRPEAHLSELELERAGYRDLELLRHPLPAASGLDRYAAALLAGEPACAEATAVVAYCASAPLAAHVASQLSDAGAEPLPVVFLDPSRCDLWHIERNYALVLEQVEAGIDPAWRRPPLEVRDRLDDPVGLGEALTADVLDRVRNALAANGFSEEECEAAKGAAAAVYVDWLNYLLAVHNRGDARAPGAVLNVLSAAHPADSAWPGKGAGTSVRVECSRAELAQREETFELIADFLAETAAAVSRVAI